jgi:phage baseplate assembly protein W
MPICDIASNLRFDHRSAAGCSGNLDKILTPSGDQAIICGEWPRLRQHVLLWLGTPLGEDIDPKCGCVLYKYVLGKLISGNLHKMEMELKANLEYNFPEYVISSVRCETTINLTTNQAAVALSVQMNDHDVGMLIDGQELLNLRQSVRSTLNKLEYITNTRS